LGSQEGRAFSCALEPTRVSSLPPSRISLLVGLFVLLVSLFALPFAIFAPLVGPFALPFAIFATLVGPFALPFAIFAPLVGPFALLRRFSRKAMLKLAA
jgi:hypothetical protein